MTQGPRHTDDSRQVLLVVNVRHAAATALATEFAERLRERHIEVALTDDDADQVDIPGARRVEAGEDSAVGCELVVVLGGDGTILRGAELARGADVPLLGVNLGHVGFLAEAEPEDIADVVDAISTRDWIVEERVAIDIVVRAGEQTLVHTWALNEMSLEKSVRERMIEVFVGVDDRPLSRWGCDGVVCATPTGSTAYAFSAGGPVVWPEVEALVVVPLSAHALFARPLVVAPDSIVALELHESSAVAVLWADGRRSVEIPPRSRIEVRRHPQPVRFARLKSAPFTDRLVAKFSLPIHGWRGDPEA
jgi:NAD+ kinase